MCSRVTLVNQLIWISDVHHYILMLAMLKATGVIGSFCNTTDHLSYQICVDGCSVGLELRAWPSGCVRCRSERQTPHPGRHPAVLKGGKQTQHRHNMRKKTLVLHCCQVNHLLCAHCGSPHPRPWLSRFAWSVGCSWHSFPNPWRCRHQFPHLTKQWRLVTTAPPAAS